ncbi:prolyl oligopeptidase family serine peptidase [Allonocardiopsis opalescens]|uniref:prolyl oligopeptidase n=1 Tax=Allonocardiopsis opalescens TaxID=1144618 RepID=A0A2T0Q234_9ACTN|nr:prolyl oligopeptidase family serine peptidase [Allonocardiopsis opalescens]PRX97738.1 prolyl oligopeptidase [Allonocardiopsis opalescens]
MPASHTAHRFPPARRDPVADVLHGRVVPDPYRWLEDGESAACEVWLAGQAALYAEHARRWPHRTAFTALCAELLGEGGGRAVPVATPPVWRGDRRFELRRADGRQLPVLVVTDPGAPPRTLLDPLDRDPSGTTTLDSWRPSPDGALLAYQLSRTGDERPLLRVLDVASGRDVDSPLIPGRPTPVVWLPDGSGFHYVEGAPSPDRPGRRLLLHRLGTRQADDAVLFETEHPQLSVKASPDGTVLMLSTAPGATSGNALWIADTAGTADGVPAWRPVHDGTAAGTRAVLKFGPGGTVFAITDEDAPFGRLCAVDPADPRSAAWRTIVPERPPAVLADCALLSEPAGGAVRLLVLRTRHGVGELTLHGGDGALLAEVPLPVAGAVSRLTAPPSAGPRAWFIATDFATPPAVYRFDLRDRACAPDAAAPPPAAGTRAPQRPEVRTVDYRSEDGTPVLMRLIGPPGADGPLPTLLTAYGGFGASIAPAYSPAVLAWVRAGGRYAVAHVRGGGEEGTGWHAAGRGSAKPNAVADLAAAAERLVERGWTTPDRLAVRGASHSGLLVAAAITRDPERYAAAVCSDPVTDMVRYPLFGLGRMWTEEFGTADDPDELDTLLGYSPYHRVTPGTRYPAVLLTCARVDPRVNALHTRKLAAALQHATSSDRPVLLRCESGVGHGARSAARWLALQADILAFCAAHTGLAAFDGGAVGATASGALAAAAPDPGGPA